VRAGQFAAIPEIGVGLGLGERFFTWLGAHAAAALGQQSGSRESGFGGFVQHDKIRISARLAPYLDKLEAYAAAQGGHISWTSGLRTPAEQAGLFARWQAGDPDVPFEPLPYSESKHSTGDAADGEASSTALALALGHYALSIGMGWSAHEPWHFEVKG